MKLGSYGDYDLQKVASAQSALITVWPNLDSWYDDLVLVGGLVPLYICATPSAGDFLPRPVTLDADVGIALGASAEGMGSLQFALLDKGFAKITTQEGLIRYAKKVGDYSVPLDFLTEYSGKTKGTVTVDDIAASILPGINRALQTARTVKVSGHDLDGNLKKVTLRVCEVGPFLALKLRAFAHRQQPKDAFDILYTLLHYDRGTNVAVAAFAEEVRLKNPACPDAIQCIEREFGSETSPAPVKAAHFVLGPTTRGESSDLRTRRLQIQQDVVSAGKLLKTALPFSAPASRETEPPPSTAA